MKRREKLGRVLSLWMGHRNRSSSVFVHARLAIAKNRVDLQNDPKRTCSSNLSTGPPEVPGRGIPQSLEFWGVVVEQGPASQGLARGQQVCGGIRSRHGIKCVGRVRRVAVVPLQAACSSETSPFGLEFVPKISPRERSVNVRHIRERFISTPSSYAQNMV